QELKAAGLLDSVNVALDKMGGIPMPGEPVEDDEGDAQIDLEEAIAESERNTTDELVAEASELGEDDTIEIKTDIEETIDKAE
ncbi:MAG: hypothetical protein JKY57_00480, partial [Kordiimonadaceae bacterium]|nr:hypothetical protein [Kordiimonadaceae bacterium]